MARVERRGVERRALAACLLVGAAVAISLGVIGSMQPEQRVLPVRWFTSVQAMKAWLSTAVLAMLVGQVLTASWMYGWIPGLRPGPGWVRTLHRASGVLAFLASLPVAFYCLYVFGFDTLTPRTYAHSVAGCVFYGVFASKMTGLRMNRLPGWTVPLLGGLLFASFAVAWWLSARWWFELVGYGR